MTNLFPVLLGYRNDDEIRTARLTGLHLLVIGIPWEVLDPHEKQALRNHSQSLKTLASRGGLGADEAVAIIEDRPHRRMSFADAHAALRKHIDAASRESVQP